MARQDYNYGAEPVKTGKSFIQPKEGNYSGRIQSIVHLGMFEDVYEGRKKDPAPFVAVTIQFAKQRDEDDKPLTTHLCFPLKQGKKAKLTAFLDAVDPEEATNGFDDVIGLPLSCAMKGGKDKDDDGKPKYVNCVGFSAVDEDFRDAVMPLEEGGVGHVTFDGMTKEALLEIHPTLHVRKVLMKSLDFKGSKAESLIEEIRKELPEFAKASSNTKDEKSGAAKEDVKDKAAPEMDEEQDF